MPLFLVHEEIKSPQRMQQSVLAKKKKLAEATFRLQSASQNVSVGRWNPPFRPIRGRELPLLKSVEKPRMVKAEIELLPLPRAHNRQNAIH